MSSYNLHLVANQNHPFEKPTKKLLELFIERSTTLGAVVMIPWLWKYNLSANN